MRPIALLLAIVLTGMLACAEEVKPAAAPTPAPSATATTPSEAELGRHTCEQIEKACKLVHDEKAIARLNMIANAIAPVTERPDVVYNCKILDTREINAESIPGGNIYVTKGLLNAVESDDELAGVLAHEIAHNSLHHVMKMMKREAPMNAIELLTALGAVFATSHNNSNNIDQVSAGQIILVSEQMKQALMNGYSRDIESQADEHGVEYLYKLKRWSPLGLYSVILGFNQIDRVQDPEQAGFIDHPYPRERKAQLEQLYEKMGIKINLWPVVNFHAEVVPPAADGKGYTVKLGKANVVTFTVRDGDKDAQTRATQAADAINERLAHIYVQQYDIGVDYHAPTADILVRFQPIFSVTKADADAAGMTLEAMGAMVDQSIKTAIWTEIVKRS